MKYAPALALAVFFMSSASHAARPQPPESPPIRRGLSAWESNKSTFFTTLATDVGIIYARPRLTLGYGSPYWQFVGIDTYFMATNSFLAPYLGWRASFPFLDALMGWRYVYPYDRRFLPPRQVQHGDDLDIGPGDERSTYNAIDFELVLVAPVLHGGMFLTAHPVWVLDAPRDVQLYEEVLRVVMQPPFAAGFRYGYVYGIGESQDLKVGFLLEYVIAPGRPKNTWRAGPVVLAGLSKHFDFLFAFSPVLSGPDELGLLHGTYAYFGILHRFAKRF